MLSIRRERREEGGGRRGGCLGFGFGISETPGGLEREGEEGVHL